VIRCRRPNRDARPFTPRPSTAGGHDRLVACRPPSNNGFQCERSRLRSEGPAPGASFLSRTLLHRRPHISEYAADVTHGIRVWLQAYRASPSPAISSRWPCASPSSCSRQEPERRQKAGLFHFAKRITDDLTADLSHLLDGFVISSGTAFNYKGKPIDARQSPIEPVPRDTTGLPMTI
jgi:hypothetical protein